MIRILAVCSGNICRSPLTAQLLQSKLPSTNYLVTSAGTAVLAGESSPIEAQRVATSMGVSGAEKHRAALLTSEKVSQADLILSMERIHRRQAARLSPTAARRAFTLLEFAHVASQLQEEELKTLIRSQLDSTAPAIEVIARMRGVVPRLSDARLYDVEDPFGRSEQTYQRSARQINAAVDHIVAFFGRARRIHRELSALSTQLLAPPANRSTRS